MTICALYVRYYKVRLDSMSISSILNTTQLDQLDNTKVQRIYGDIKTTF